MSKQEQLLSRYGANLAESMGANRSGSGQGGAAAPSPGGPSRHDGVTRLRSAVEIEVDRIAPDPDQPRTEFDPEAIARLARSLETHGQLQPISVRWDEAAGRYIIVTGERRWRASREAGRKTIAAVLVEGERSDAQILELQLIENCIREDLKPIEQAKAFRALMERNGWTASRLAEALHLTPATVSRSLSLLDLPGTVQDAVDAGQLAPSAAYEVSKVADRSEQESLAAEAVAGKLNRDEVARAARQRKPRPGKGGKPRERKVTSRTFRAANGCKITIEHRRGVDPSLIAEALADVLGQVEATTTAEAPPVEATTTPEVAPTEAA